MSGVALDDPTQSIFESRCSHDKGCHMPLDGITVSKDQGTLFSTTLIEKELGFILSSKDLFPISSSKNLEDPPMGLYEAFSALENLVKGRNTNVHIYSQVSEKAPSPSPKPPEPPSSWYQLLSQKPMGLVDHGIVEGGMAPCVEPPN
jgi:hypothetical protein